MLILIKSNLSTVTKNLGKSSSPHAHCGQSVYVLVKYEIPYLQRSGKRKEKNICNFLKFLCIFYGILKKKGVISLRYVKEKRKYILRVFVFRFPKKLFTVFLWWSIIVTLEFLEASNFLFLFIFLNNTIKDINDLQPLPC